MPSPFEVVTDKFGRINHYVPTGFPDIHIQPKEMGEHLDGGERVAFDGSEYNLTENGSLVHPDIEVIPSVQLGSGVRIGEGTVFRPFIKSLREPDNTIEIGDGTRIEGTEVHDQVSIGQYAVIRAAFLGIGTTIGERTTIGPDTRVDSLVTIADRVKLGNNVQLASGVVVESRARIGYDTRVFRDAHIGREARVGKSSGEGSRGINHGGVILRAGIQVAAGESID